MTALVNKGRTVDVVYTTCSDLMLSCIILTRRTSSIHFCVLKHILVKEDSAKTANWLNYKAQWVTISGMMFSWKLVPDLH